MHTTSTTSATSVLDELCQDLEANLCLAVTNIRERLAEHNVPEMRLDIEVSGRTATGDLRIEFVLGARSYNGSANARGGRLVPVVEEMLHRYGWRKRNAPLCLPAGSLVPEQDDTSSQ